MQNCCCENCLFGVLAPIRYATKTKRTNKIEIRDVPQSALHCTINPPAYLSGFPIAEGSAVCALYTTREDEPKQPLRSLMQSSGAPGFTVTMKG